MMHRRKNKYRSKTIYSLKGNGKRMKIQTTEKIFANRGLVSPLYKEFFKQENNPLQNGQKA